MGIVSPSPSELMGNTLAFGIPSVVFFFMRILNSRWVLKKFQLEDYLMCLTFCFYSSMLTFINISASYNSNLFPPELAAAILSNPSDVQNRILGSKLVIPLEQSMLLSTWGVKTCIWLFLRRLCRQLPKFQLALTILITYIWVGYLVIQVCYYALFCRPFSQYWAVPPKNEQCATYAHYSYVQMTFNITSDICLIVIPIRMFWIARLPLKRKVVLMAVFSMALFTIIAAILNKAFNFLSPMTTTYQLWYIREASVAIWVGNIICCWQLFQRLFKIRSFDNSSDNIVAQPEMTARAHPSQYSTGGHLKDARWYQHARERMAEMNPRFHGALNNCRQFLSVASRSETSQPSGGSRVGVQQGIVTDNNSTLAGEECNEKAAGEPTTLVTLNRDGDDATTAIEYRNRENIV